MSRTDLLERYGIRKYCVIDKKVFYIPKNSNRKHGGLYFRPKNSVTCCGKCSRINLRYKPVQLKLIKPENLLIAQ